MRMVGKREGGWLTSEMFLMGHVPSACLCHHLLSRAGRIFMSLTG